jgi:hypothetical protein
MESGTRKGGTPNDSGIDLHMSFCAPEVQRWVLCVPYETQLPHSLLGYQRHNLFLIGIALVYSCNQAQYLTSVPVLHYEVLQTRSDALPVELQILEGGYEVEEGGEG